MSVRPMREQPAPGSTVGDEGAWCSPSVSTGGWVRRSWLPAPKVSAVAPVGPARWTLAGLKLEWLSDMRATGLLQEVVHVAESTRVAPAALAMTFWASRLAAP